MTRSEYIARLRTNVESAEVAMSRAARRVDEAEADGSASAEEIAHSRDVTLPRLAARVEQAEKALAQYLKEVS
jgi:hypothetical protein